MSKKIAVFEVEFDTEYMCDDETLKQEYNNDWKEFIEYMINEEGIIGIFNEPLVLTEIKQPTPTKQNKER